MFTVECEDAGSAKKYRPLVEATFQDQAKRFADYQNNKPPADDPRVLFSGPGMGGFLSAALGRSAKVEVADNVLTVTSSVPAKAFAEPLARSIGTLVRKK